MVNLVVSGTVLVDGVAFATILPEIKSNWGSAQCLIPLEVGAAPSKATSASVANGAVASVVLGSMLWRHVERLLLV